MAAVIDADALGKLSRDEKLQLIQILEERERRKRLRIIDSMFPDTGPRRRELYPKHIEFFRLGAEHRERAFIAANRVGKTVAGGYENTCHLTGEYPHWWEGARFADPVRVMVAGETIASTRDVIQSKMVGGTKEEDFGTGLIPRASIIDWAFRGHVVGALDYVRVKHEPTGGISTLWFRSYDQGRKIFQGFELEVFWADEEVPDDVYSEGMVRTMTTGGMGMLTFTPLKGLTPLVQSFLPEGRLTDE